MSNAAPDYPLKLTPIYKDKVWGGATLREQLGRDIPSDSVGESWELVDLAQTSASGGGGGSEFSVIANGPLAGTTLHDAIAMHGSALMGNLPLSEAGGFPILLKYLDAKRNLSVQVHPSPAYAAAHDDAFLKSESWYIVHAEPDAVIYKGMAPGVTPEQLRAALEQNNDEAVVPLMEAHRVRAGDCHYLPSGTCHALGGGILVAEVQTPSDTTFRVYDWGREGRELHVDAAIDCIDFAPAQTAQHDTRTPVGNAKLNSSHSQVTRVVSCEHFVVHEVRAEPGFADACGEPEVTAWMVLEGAVTLTCDAGETVELVAGDTVLLPPAMSGGEVRSAEGALFLEISFPQAYASRLA